MGILYYNKSQSEKELKTTQDNSLFTKLKTEEKSSKQCLFGGAKNCGSHKLKDHESKT